MLVSTCWCTVSSYAAPCPSPSPQDDPSTELEAEIRTLGKGDIPLSSLPLGQEERHPVVLGEVRLGPLPHPGVLKGDG